jgi:hypothetical protein
VKICEAIARDHAEAEALFEELALVAGDVRNPSQALRIAARLTIMLKTQVLAEERVLYEALRSAGDPLAIWAREGPHLYHALDVVLDKLCVLRPGPELKAAVEVARRLFHDHVEREAAELLPAVGAELRPQEAEQLARDLDAEKRRLRPRIERQIAI